MDLPIPILTAAFAEPIGISFDARTIHAAQVVRAKGRATLVGAVRLRREMAKAPEGPAALTREEVSRLVKALSLQGVHTRRAVLAVPAPQALLTAIELPPRSSGAPIEQIAEMELARLQRVEPGTFEMALWELPKVQNRTGKSAANSFIAATATHEVGEALSAGFDGSGLGVMSLIPESLAVAKAAANLPESRAVVSISWNAVEIVVLSEEAKIVYHRALPELGLHRIYAAAADRMSLPAEGVDGALGALTAGGTSPTGAALEAHLKSLAESVQRLVHEHAEFVAGEVEKSLTYAARFVPECEHTPIRVVGEGASLPGMCAMLSRLLGTEATALACGEIVAMSGGGSRHLGSSDFVASVGAAMWTQSVSGRLVA